MAVTVEQTVSSAQTSTVTNHDVAITPGANADKVLLAFFTVFRSGRTAARVLYAPGTGNEATFTELGQVGNYLGNGDMTVSILLDADIQNSVPVTIRGECELEAGGASTARGVIAVLEASLVDQATPNGAVTTVPELLAVDTINIDIASVTDGIVAGCCNFASNINPSTPPQVDFTGLPVNYTSSQFGAAYRPDAGNPTTITFTSSQANTNGIGVGLNPSAAGPTFPQATIGGSRIQQGF